MLTAQITEVFIQEHDMEVWWDALLNQRQTFFYRQITAVDPVSGSVLIDIPTRYPLKLRDEAAIFKAASPNREIGIEDLSIGNRENPKSGWGENDYNVPGTGAYDTDNTRIISISNVVDSWVQRVHTYKPSVNTLPDEIHILSRGIALSNTRNVSILDNDIRNPQYRGANGNGYLFSVSGNDNLLAGNTAVNGRHNYTFSNMNTNGNVIFDSYSGTPTHALDFHMFLSMANLLDNIRLKNDLIHASIRPNPAASERKHGQTTSESVIWNTYGDGYLRNNQAIIDSRQYGHGYVIGTQGPAYEVQSTPLVISERSSAPEDFVEGVGQGSLLNPHSLYLDQFDRRMARQASELADIRINGAPLAGFQRGKRVYNVELPYGTGAQDIPVVTAVAADPAAGVSISPASSVPGQAIITVTAPGGAGSQVYVLNFTVGSPPSLVALFLEPDPADGAWKAGPPRIEVGSTGALRLSGVMSDGSSFDTSQIASLTFTSSNSAVAAVNSQGEVTGIAVGTAQITAEAVVGGQTFISSATVAVSPAYLAPALPALPIVGVLASADDGNVPENTVDQDMDTRWSASGAGQWIRYELGGTADVSAVSIAFYNGHQRQAIFDLQVSLDGEAWQTVYSGLSSGTTIEFETFEFEDTVQAKYVRFLGQGNSVNAWNSITEFLIHPPEASLELLQTLTALHIAEEAVRQPLSVQLSNSLRQVEHHSSRGAQPQALTHLENYIRHLNNGPMQQHIEEEVQQRLNRLAEALRAVWGE